MSIPKGLTTVVTLVITPSELRAHARSHNRSLPLSAEGCFLMEQTLGTPRQPGEIKPGMGEFPEIWNNPPVGCFTVVGGPRASRGGSSWHLNVIGQPTDTYACSSMRGPAAG